MARSLPQRCTLPGRTPRPRRGSRTLERKAVRRHLGSLRDFRYEDPQLPTLFAIERRKGGRGSWLAVEAANHPRDASEVSATSATKTLSYRPCLRLSGAREGEAPGSPSKRQTSPRCLGSLRDFRYEDPQLPTLLAIERRKGGRGSWLAVKRQTIPAMPRKSPRLPLRRPSVTDLACD